MKPSQHAGDPATRELAHGRRPSNRLYCSRRFPGDSLAMRPTPMPPLAADAKLFAWLLKPSREPFSTGKVNSVNELMR